MKKELQKHLADYLILITSGVFFLIFLRSFSGGRQTMFVAVLVFSSFYILWGIFHHTANKNLHLKNVIEYILIGFLVLFVIEALLL
jgi:hypothetical protein